MSGVAYAQALRLRMFLEGIEVPIIAIQTQSAPNSPTVATIQIPPLAEATRFHPRTTVHVFFLDIYRESPALYTTGSTSTYQSDLDPNAAKDEHNITVPGESGEISGSQKDADAAQWKLLFGGEIIGWSWTKTPINRSVILQCEDWSNYWDTAYQADNTSIFGPDIKSVFSGASTNLFTDMLFPGQSHIITQIVSSGRCNTYPDLKGLAAGIVRLVEAVGGSYYVFPGGDKKQPPKRIAGQNIFFSYNELRLHLTQLIGCPSKDETSEGLLRVQGYTGLFNRSLGGSGGLTSIRKAMTALSRIIFYEMFPQPCPKYRPGTYDSPSGTRRVSVKEHPQFGQFCTVAENVMDSLLGISNDINASVDGMDADLLRDSVGIEWLPIIEDMQKLLLRTRARMTGAPEPMPSKFSVAATHVGKAATSFTQILTSSNSADYASLLRAAAQALDAAAGELQLATETTVLMGTGKERRPAQLFQHLFRPDVWFCAPPRCNVLFPELYHQMSYQRSLLQEPTRFMLKTNDELLGENMFTDQFYFSPKGQTTAQNRLQWTTILKNGLLMHERFTGILPVFEKMGEFNVFAARTFGETRADTNKVGLAQRTANFLYFRHRFNARRMTVDGKFNPYVAVGMPGLILDRWVDQESLARHAELRAQVAEMTGKDVPTMDTSAALGTNFLGNFAQVSHQISNQEQQGVTSITITFPRQPEESIELLGTVADADRVQRRVEGSDARRTTVVASMSPPALYSLGPNGGKVVVVVDVTEEYTDREDIPYFSSSERKTTTWKRTNVPINVPVTAQQLGAQAVLDDVDSPDRVIVFGAYKITEEIPRYRIEEMKLPAEEYIRPGWYGPIWTNRKIGGVYQDLLSTGAITDPQIVQDYGRTDVQLHDEGMLVNTEEYGRPSGDEAFNKLPSLDEGASIQDAAEYLTTLYSHIKRAELDVDEFIGAYTWRPIASMLDMFGSYDLEYSADGSVVVSGVEGFHSRAFGPYQNLFGLVDADISSILGIKRDAIAATQVDTRLEKRQQVERYVASLLFSTAILG